MVTSRKTRRRKKREESDAKASDSDLIHIVPSGIIDLIILISALMPKNSTKLSDDDGEYKRNKHDYNYY